MSERSRRWATSGSRRAEADRSPSRRKLPISPTGTAGSWMRFRAVPRPRPAKRCSRVSRSCWAGPGEAGNRRRDWKGGWRRAGPPRGAGATSRSTPPSTPRTRASAATAPGTSRPASNCSTLRGSATCGPGSRQRTSNWPGDRWIRSPCSSPARAPASPEPTRWTLNSMRSVIPASRSPAGASWSAATSGARA